MDRPSFIEIYMGLATSLAERSTCKRLRVGTAITSTDFRKVLAIGYNGNAAGLPNTCDSDTPGACGCLHSEENAIINYDSPRAVDKFVFCTHMPCVMCAKRLINLGNVDSVFYKNPYRLLDGVRLLTRTGIKVFQFFDKIGDNESVALVAPPLNGGNTVPVFRLRGGEPKFVGHEDWGRWDVLGNQGHRKEGV